MGTSPSSYVQVPPPPSISYCIALAFHLRSIYLMSYSSEDHLIQNVHRFLENFTKSPQKNCTEFVRKARKFQKEIFKTFQTSFQIYKISENPEFSENIPRIDQKLQTQKKYSCFIKRRMHNKKEEFSKLREF